MELSTKVKSMSTRTRRRDSGPKSFLMGLSLKVSSKVVGRMAKDD